MNNRSEAMIHIVDDDLSMREALARVLIASGYAVDTYASADEFLATELAGGPRCMLLDLELLGASGLELQQALRQRGDAMPIIFMSAYADIPRTVQAIKGGASDFLVKPIPAATLLAAIETALAVDTTQIGREPSPDRPAAQLSDREQTVLHGIVAGRLNKQIAYDLNLSERTIKTCRAEVMRKLGARSLAELVRVAAALPRH